ADDLAALGPPRDVVDGPVPVLVGLDEAVDDERDVGIFLPDRLAGLPEPAVGGEAADAEQQSKQGRSDEPGLGVATIGDPDRDALRDRQLEHGLGEADLVQPDLSWPAERAVRRRDEDP